jgi:tRNA A-37 threonylcarbamoyl transferase component Bud32
MSEAVPEDMSRIGEVGSRFEAAWRRGDRPRIEDYLHGFSGATRDELLRHLLRVEWKLRRDRDDVPTRREYELRFPLDVAAVRAAVPLDSEDLSGNHAAPSPDEPAVTVDHIYGNDRPPAPRLGFDADATVSYVEARPGGKVVSRLNETTAGQLDRFATGMVLRGRYRLSRELGRGVMGIVFLGVDEVLDRSVAVKAMLPPRRQRTREEQEAMERIFADEAKLGANLSEHANIATVFDYGFHEGLPYTVFEYVEGESVRQLLKRKGRLPLDDVLLFLEPVAKALDFAHGRRVVHRDLKPDNIRVTRDGEFKVLDLGLARQFDRDSNWGFAGTPAYASPEQAAEQPIDGRSDQYALAVIAFEMLTGRRPFLANDVWPLLLKHRKEPPPDPKALAPSLTDRQASALLKALSKNPNERFQSCWAFATALGCGGAEGVVATRDIVLETECRPRFRFLVRQLDRAYLVLTSDALWTGHIGFVRRWPLAALEEVRIRRLGKRLRLTFAVVGGTSQAVEYRIPRWASCEEWSKALTRLKRAAQEVIEPERPQTTGEPRSRTAIVADFLRKNVQERRVTPIDAPPAEKSVILLRQHPNLRYQVLGPIEVEHPHRRGAEGLLQVRGALLGADAVIDVLREVRPRFDRTTRHLAGTAVRALDSHGRLELRARWFQEESALVGGRILVLALFYLFLFVIVNPYFWTTLLRPERWLVVAMTLAFVLGTHGWHFLIGGFMRWLKWPQLAHPAALSLAGEAMATVAGTLVGGLVAFLARPERLLRIEYRWVLLISAVVIPIALFFINYQLMLARRTWRAYDVYRFEFPAEPPPVAAHRRWVAAACTVYAGLLTLGAALSSSWGMFALCTLGFSALRPR